jgi:tetratricopeptide (TPR) repeat protein
MRAQFFVAVIGVFVSSVMPGQDVDRAADRFHGFKVRGEIVTSRPLIGGYSVELAGDTGLAESVPISGDGSFEIRAAQSGMQELRVVSPRGEIIHREPIVINGPYQQLAIRLPETASVPRAGSNTVSVHQLEHKVPPEAKKAFDRGLRAAAEANYTEAISAFRQAVSVDPEYADGLNELGVAEAATGNMESAAEDFQKAINVAPEHPAALPNLSIALAKLRRFHDAGEVARRALKVVPESGRIRYILAASILMDNGDPHEALTNLERASDEIPKAHLVAADVLVALGRPEDAIKHLEQFLKAAPPDDKDRPAAEARLSVLRH